MLEIRLDLGGRKQLCLSLCLSLCTLHYSLGHDLADIFGIQLGILLLLLTWHVHRHVLHLDVAEHLCKCQPEQVHRSGPTPRPSEGISPIRVSDNNRLDGNSRIKCSQFEADQG